MLLTSLVVAAEVVLVDRWQAFVIVSPGCKPCRQLTAGLTVELAREATPTNWRLALIVPGVDGMERLESEGPLPAGTTALLDTQGNVHHVWGIRRTPFLVVVDSGATVRSVVAGPSIESLRNHALDSS
jgi:hypothetical protein